MAMAAQGFTNYGGVERRRSAEGVEGGEFGVGLEIIINNIAIVVARQSITARELVGHTDSAESGEQNVVASGIDLGKVASVEYVEEEVGLIVILPVVEDGLSDIIDKLSLGEGGGDEG